MGDESRTPAAGGQAVDPGCAPFQPEGEAPDSTATPVHPRWTEAETIARCFHGVYEQLAPKFGYKTRDASAVDWGDVPENNKNLMCATVVALLDTGVIRPGAAVTS